MQKTMKAKYKGRCAISGATIYPGDEITFDTITRKAWIVEPGDMQVDSGTYLASRTRTNPNYVSHVFNVGGREYYQNKAGRCIDAPCCGCCTI